MARTEQAIVRPIQTTRYFPESGQPGEYRAPDRFPVAVEKVPQLVEEVVVNPVAQELLMADFRYLTTKDYLRENACLTVPMARGGGVLSPDYWGRAVPLGYGGIPYGHFVGGTVMGKGCFRSGKYYERLRDLRSTRDMPIGFFGATDAEKEMEIGNSLLAVDFRSSLVLGYAILKPVETKSFLLNRWRTNGEVELDIERCFLLLSQAVDKPAFMARVAGVTSRLHVIKPLNLYRRAEVVRAAGLLMDESTRNPDHFSLYLAGDNSNEKIRVVLDKTNRRVRLVEDEFLALVRLYTGIFERNNLALVEAKKHPVLAKYSDLGFVLGAPKDNDPMSLTLDFEETKTISTHHPALDFVAGYANYARWLAGWLNGEVGPNFVIGYKDKKDEFKQMVYAAFGLA